MSRKRAAVVAVVLEVHCPHCGEPQPNPDDGGHGWSPDEVRARAALDVAAGCASCDLEFLVISERKYQVVA